MNREIKFRAWDSVGKYMVDASYGNFISFDGVLYEEADKKYNTPHTEIEKSKHLILMQFTGLKDSKGLEIYEDDLFQVMGNKIYQVKYCNGAEFNYEWMGGTFILFLNDEIFFPFDENAMKHGEVIGNIHQDKHLLT